MTRDQHNKISAAILTLIVPILFAALVGCGAPDIGMNPYLLLTKIDDVDHTNFFIATYDSMIGAGLTSLTQEEIEAISEESNSSSSTSDDE